MPSSSNRTACTPAHFSDLRRAAHELHTVADLKAFLFHVADEVERSYSGLPCTWCHVRISPYLSAPPCLVFE